MSTILVNANIYVERGNFQEAMLIENGIIKACLLYTSRCV